MQSKYDGELQTNGSDATLHEELGSFNNEPKAKRIGKLPDCSTVAEVSEADDSFSVSLNPDAFSTMRRGTKHVGNETGRAGDDHEEPEADD